MAKKITEAEMKALDSVLAVQCSNGNWNYDPYMMGLANGLILARHILRNDEGVPPYKTQPKQWLADRPKVVALPEMYKPRRRKPKPATKEKP